MRESWYAELSGVHYKMGQWWVPEREENGILLYRGSKERPAGAVQKLTPRQEKRYCEEESELCFALGYAEWKGDEPELILPLYRNGKQTGVQREYFGKTARVLKRYLYVDYGGERETYIAASYDESFSDFVKKYV